MQFAPHTDDDVREMLEACGLSSLDDLFGHLPRNVLIKGELNLPEGLSEMELVAA